MNCSQVRNTCSEDICPDIDRIIRNGYCIGCGACACVGKSYLRMVLNHIGLYNPVNTSKGSSKEDEQIVSGVCPFSDAAPNEDIIGNELFSDCPSFDPRLGYYRYTYVGYSCEGAYREKGSSGGLTSWLLAYLLNSHTIDYVLHVKPLDHKHDVLFAYSVSDNVESLKTGAKSHYYPTEISSVISFLRENPGKYAFVGVPCAVKAVRLLQKTDSLIDDRVKFCISIFCGHMKSIAFAGAMAWEMGIPPENLNYIDFRVKKYDKPANRYSVRATGQFNGIEHTVEMPSSDLFASDWGIGMFKPNACDFCDDIAGETADVTFGDAWLPKYVVDGRGTNIIVVRSQELDNILTDGCKSGEITLEQVDAETVAQSQAGNFRHRREGLAYRIWLLDQQGKWHPTKRVKANRNHLTPRRRLLYELRALASEKSHTAFAEAKASNKFSTFSGEMRGILYRYHRVNGTYHRFLAKTVLNSIRRLTKRLCNR
jgi:coenzyme F420 hydrogenase subunit beta